MTIECRLDEGVRELTNGDDSEWEDPDERIQTVHKDSTEEISVFDLFD